MGRFFDDEVVIWVDVKWPEEKLLVERKKYF